LTSHPGSVPSDYSCAEKIPRRTDAFACVGAHPAGAQQPAQRIEKSGLLLFSIAAGRAQEKRM